MKTPIIETERMILRPLSIKDAPDIYERWTSDERVAKYVRWSTHENLEATKGWLAFEESNVNNEYVYQWGFELKENHYLFGCGGINYKELEGLFELGYNIMFDYWNQGYTTEAAKAIIEFAHLKLGQDELVACHAKENPASGRILEKCGFHYENDGVQTKFDGITSLEIKSYRRILKN